jgi:hypothetical protein
MMRVQPGVTVLALQDGVIIVGVTHLSSPPDPKTGSRLGDWAIIVGVTHYPGLSSLHGPENDADDFFKWVTA